MVEIHVDGLEELLNRLQEIQGGRYVKPALSAIGQSIRRRAGEYPPTTIANSPQNPTGRWYERGYGARYASGGGNPTSEMMNRRWYVRPEQWAVLIGNTASYSPYVHGQEQARFHGERGWKKVEEVAEEDLPELLDKLGDQIERIWSRV
jgi:hypothetical protein